jgi:hypothetical protein
MDQKQSMSREELQQKRLVKLRMRVTVLTLGAMVFASVLALVLVVRADMSPPAPGRVIFALGAWLFCVLCVCEGVDKTLEFFQELHRPTDES